MSRRSSVAVLIAMALAAGACEQSDSTTIDVEASDLRPASANEVRGGKVLDFFLGLSTRDLHRFASSLCDGYADADQLSLTLDRVTEIDAEDWYSHFEEVSTELSDNPLVFDVGIGTIRGEAQIYVTAGVDACVYAVVADNPELTSLIDPLSDGL